MTDYSSTQAARLTSHNIHAVAGLAFDTDLEQIRHYMQHSCSMHTTELTRLNTQVITKLQTSCRSNSSSIIFYKKKRNKCCINNKCCNKRLVSPSEHIDVSLTYTVSALLKRFFFSSAYIWVQWSEPVQCTLVLSVWGMPQVYSIFISRNKKRACVKLPSTSRLSLNFLIHSVNLIIITRRPSRMLHVYPPTGSTAYEGEMSTLPTLLLGYGTPSSFFHLDKSFIHRAPATVALEHHMGSAIH